jgi:hypothetical protein
MSETYKQWGQRMVLVGSLAVTIALLAVVLYHIDTASLDVVFADLWGLLPAVAHFLSGRGTITALWQAHNENRDVILTLLLVGSAKFTHLNLQYIKYLGVGIEAVTYGLLLSFYRKYANHSLETLPAFTVVAAVLFSLNQWESYLMAINVVFFIAVFFVIWAVLAVERTNSILWTASLSVLATLSSAEGLVVWPLLTCHYILKRQYKLAGAYAAIGGAVIVSYLRGLGQQVNIHFLTRNIIYVIHFLLVVMGNTVMGFFNNRPSLTLDAVSGTFLLAIGSLTVVDYLIKRSRNDTSISTQRVAVLLFIFGLGSALYITIGRAPMGLEMAAASRYSTLTVGLALGPYLYCFGDPNSGYRIAFGMVGCLIVLGVVVGDIEEARMGPYRLQYYQALEFTLKHGPYTNKALAPFLWSVPAIKSGIQILRHYKLNVFYR